MDPDAELTRLLQAAAEGDAASREAALPLLYDQLRGLARAALASERADHTLQPTALVHEAWLRLSRERGTPADRRHFLALAGQAMRRVLVNHARDRKALKRGGGRPRTELRDEHGVEPGDGVDLLALDEALEQLEALDPRKARLVELRYFAGLDVGETAAALETSASTVKREWALVRVWLLRKLGGAA